MNNSDIKDYVVACLSNELYMKSCIRRYGGVSNDASINSDQMADAIIRLHKSVKELAIKFDIYKGEDE